MDSPIIVSITDFRRNAGAYINRAIPLTIVRNSKIVGEYIPAQKDATMTPEERVKKVRNLAGKLHLGIDLTPEQMNEDYDKMYDEMLPRQ